MFEKLQKIKEKYEMIAEQLQSAEVIANQNLFRDLSKEYKTLTPVVEAYDKYLGIVNSIEEAKDILKDPDSDDELRELAQTELDNSFEQKNKAEQDLRIMLLPKDENDERNVIMEVKKPLCLQLIYIECTVCTLLLRTGK